MQKSRPKLNPVIWYITVAMVILVACVDIFIESYFLQKATNHQRADIQSELSLIRSRIEGVINSNIQLVQGLASVISTKPDIDQGYFARISEDIIKNSNIIRNIAAAPNLVISLMHPMQGNEAALGLDFNTDPQQRATAHKAINTRKLVLAGPLELKQGGIGFIARIPVYTTDEDNSTQSRLWGLISSVMDVDKFYREAGISEEMPKLKLAIRGTDAEGSTGQQFYGPATIYALSPVTETINLPYGAWQLAAIPQQGWPTTLPNIWLIRGISLLTAILLVTLILVESINQSKKNRLKEELKSANYRFTLVLDSMNAVVHVSDMETHEILYANPKAIETFGEGLVGSKCWQRFQKNRSAACSFCSNHNLIEIMQDEDPTLTEDIQNSYTGTWFHCEAQAIPWDDNRIVRLEVATDITKIKHNEKLLSDAHKVLEKSAYFDQLTNLPNRRRFTHCFQEIVAHTNLEQEQLIICYLDLDGFKQVNDNYGHAVGDKFLKMIAHRLHSTMREHDVLARWGGDEFALIIKVADMDEATSLLERILGKVSDSYVCDGNQVDISTSIGVAVYSSRDNDIDTLLRQADQAMYIAKQRGKQQFCFFDADKDRKIHALQAMVGDISRAIANEEMVLYYQPKLSLSQRRIYGVEVLVRWLHPEKGLLPPVEFLPYIRGTDTQTELDWWVIEKAINQALQWQRHHVNLGVSINVSPGTLQQEDFISRLIQVLDNRQLKKGRIELEILESDVADIEKIIHVIKNLKVFNISFALDDYGTGYSSLTYLRKLPVHTVKIDQSFVRDMLCDKNDLNIVEGVIGLARVFDREVIAEGVETMEHGVKLASMQCYNLQGYGIARPMPLAEFNNWLAQYQIPEEWMI